MFPSSSKRAGRHLIGFPIGPSIVVVSACHLPKMGTHPVPKTWGFNLCFKHGMKDKADTVNDSKCDVLSLESYRIVLDTYQLGYIAELTHSFCQLNPLI